MAKEEGLESDGPDRGVVVLAARAGCGAWRYGFVDLSHALFGIGLFADVRVILAGQLAVGPAEVVFGGVARHAEGFLIALEIHVLVAW